MRVCIKPGKAQGTLFLPPSKSLAHRLLLGAACAKGESKIMGFSLSDDLRATLSCIQTLGASVTLQGDCVSVYGAGDRLPDSFLKTFSCRESGTTLRLMIPLALAFGKQNVFTCLPSLRKRGIRVYEEILPAKGICMNWEEEGLYLSGNLQGGNYTLRGDESSQYVSGLLLALPLLEEDSTLTILPPFESRPYVSLTLSVMEKLGIWAEKRGDCFFIPGKQTYHPFTETLEGDWSNAAPFLALNEIGSMIRLCGLSCDSKQGDKVIMDFLKRLNQPCPCIDLTDYPDLGPVLFALSALKNGAVFTGIHRLRNKESDRVQAMQQVLRSFQIKMEAEENRVRVYAALPQPPFSFLPSYNDHRIVMAETVLATVTGAEISDAQCIDKSYPAFFDDLKKLGIGIEWKV